MIYLIHWKNLKRIQFFLNQDNMELLMQVTVASIDNGSQKTSLQPM